MSKTQPAPIDRIKHFADAEVSDDVLLKALWIERLPDIIKSCALVITAVGGLTSGFGYLLWLGAVRGWW